MHKRKLNSYLPTLQKLFVSLSTWLVYYVYVALFSCASTTKKNKSPSRCSNLPPDWLHRDPSFAVDWWPSYSPHHCEQHLMYPDEKEGPEVGSWENTCTKKSASTKTTVLGQVFVAGSFPQNHAVLRLRHGFSVIMWKEADYVLWGLMKYLETTNCKEMEPTRWAPYEWKMELQALVVSCNYHHLCQGCAVSMAEKARFLWFQLLVENQTGLPEMPYRKRIFKGVCSSVLKEFRQPCFIPDTLPKFNIAPENAWFQLEDYFPFGKEHNASRAMLNFGGAILKKTYPRPSPLEKAFGSSKHT